MDPIEASRHLTENLYYIIGVSVVSGLGAIIAGVTFAFKKIIWIARMEFRIERLEKDLNAAFEKIRCDQSKIRLISDLEREIGKLSNELRRNE